MLGSWKWSPRPAALTYRVRQRLVKRKRKGQAHRASRRRTASDARKEAHAARRPADFRHQLIGIVQPVITPGVADDDIATLMVKVQRGAAHQQVKSRFCASRLRLGELKGLASMSDATTRPL